jgi:biotin transport system substrate-specific component
MQITTNYYHLKQMTAGFFQWRRELDIAQSLALALSYACLTAALAQISFYLPWSPVPVTGQTFAVLLGAVLLGRWGGVSQLMYAGLGVAGIPLFAGAKGVGALFGPTGGYVIGFVVAAFVLGFWAEKNMQKCGFLKLFTIMLFANFVVIYGFGLTQLYLWLSLVSGAPVGLPDLLLAGAIPFVIGDFIKVISAAAIAKTISSDN